MTTQNNKHKSCDFAGCFCLIEKDKTYCKSHQRLKDFQDTIKQQTGKKYDLSAIFATGLDIKNRVIVDTGVVDTGVVEKKRKHNYEKAKIKKEDYIIYDKTLNLIHDNYVFKRDAVMELVRLKNNENYEIIKRRLPRNYDIVLVKEGNKIINKDSIENIASLYNVKAATLKWRLTETKNFKNGLSFERQTLSSLLKQEIESLRQQIKQEHFTLKEKLKQKIKHIQDGSEGRSIRVMVAKEKQKTNDKFVDFLKKKKKEMLCFVDCDSEENKKQLQNFFDTIKKYIENAK